MKSRSFHWSVNDAGQGLSRGVAYAEQNKLQLESSCFELQKSESFSETKPESGRSKALESESEAGLPSHPALVVISTELATSFIPPFCMKRRCSTLRTLAILAMIDSHD